MPQHITITVEVSELPKRKQSTRVDRGPKMGRPRTAAELRISRGVRLDPELIGRADKFVGREDYPQICNFTNLVEVALTEWLARNESGTTQVVKARRKAG